MTDKLFLRGKNVIKYHLNLSTVACLSAAFLLISCPNFSPVHAAEQTVDECSRELLLTYFPEPFVRETLKTFNVPEEKWGDIQKALASKDKDIIQIVEKKAAEMEPNPLKDDNSQSRQAAIKLFRTTLFQLFAEVMQANGITDEKQIQAMLDSIQLQKAQRFAKCMQKSEEKPQD